jgi:transcriptional regulator with XRE-family HTH domain
MKDLSQLRRDLRVVMSSANLSQSAIARKSGVDQASLSRFLRTNNPEGLSGGAILRLLPLIYGIPLSDLRPELPQPVLSTSSADPEKT